MTEPGTIQEEWDELETASVPEPGTPPPESLKTVGGVMRKSASDSRVCTPAYDPATVGTMLLRPSLHY